MSADQPIRLLIIESSSNDAEMITNVLRNAGHPVRARRIEDEEDMQIALDEQPWDLIVSAPELDEFDVRQALEMIKKTEKDIPVIVVANGAGEISAAGAMQAGARDFVDKGDPERLQWVIEREIIDLEGRREHRRCKKAMRETERRCRSLIDSSRDAITYVHEGMHIYANQVYMDMFGYTDPDEIEGMPIMDMVAPNDHDKFKKFLRNFIKSGEELRGEIEVNGIRTDSTTFSAVMEFSPASIDGEACTQIIIRSQSDRELEQKLNYLSKQDLLTGLYNRQYLLESLDNAVSKASTEAVNSALLYIDLDDFDAIKESVGIAASDLVLGDIAKILGEKIIEPDIAARFGDHSFCALLHKRTNDQAAEVAESIRQAVEDHIADVSGQSVTTTCSIGVSTISENAPSSQDILTRGDVACGVARSSGGNTVHVHNPVEDAQAGAEHSAEWIEVIQDALANDKFFLVFQPIVSLHGDTEENYETLLRLRDDKGNDILPAQFLNAAEHAHLMSDIDRWVVEHAIKRLAEEHARGKRINFFVKVSADALKDESLLPWISQLLKDNRLGGDSLRFEITESAAVMHLTHAKAFIAGLKQLRCKLLLDHFGSGLNSIKNLKHLDVDYLKIDGALIHDLASDNQSQETVTSLIQTAHSMGKLTIAEFVQDANSLAILWQCGVNYIQGYFLQGPTDRLDYDFTSDG